MEILSDIRSLDLSDRLDEKEDEKNSFNEIYLSRAINIKNGYQNKVYTLKDVDLTIEITSSGIQAGDSVLIIGNTLGTSTVTTSDLAHPSQNIYLSAGNHVKCLWDGTKWLFVGNYML